MSRLIRVLASLVLLWAVAPFVIAPFAAAQDQVAPSFVHDVMPLLTRLGCNSGGCHGKLAGQAGFRLSLRGYAPELDHAWISREEIARRLDLQSPENSLLLAKPLCDVSHGGGKLMAKGSPAHKLLLDWIKAGAPGPQSTDPTVQRLEIQPHRQNMKPGDTASLKVVAHFSNGQTRDVTWLTRFASNEPSLVSVNAEGQVKALRHGETAVRAAFEGQVEIAVFTIPFEQAVESALYAERRNVIDEHVLNKLAALHLPPAEPCDDATFLRRAFLDCLGALPAPDEVRAFLADTRPDKRAQLVEQMFQRPEFVDYWTLLLGDLLQNRKERDHDVRGSKGVRELHHWLRKQVAVNRPWNELAREVLTAQGSNIEHPAVGYYVVTVGEKEAQQSEVADSVAQAFLGTRIGCARCHNHPLEKYTQDDYYHFVAFFSRVTLDRKNPDEGPTVLNVGTRQTVNTQRDIAREQDNLAKLKAQPATEEQAKQTVELEKRLGQLREQLQRERQSPVGVSQPRTGKFLAPRPLDRLAIVAAAEEDPRAKLADWMIDPRNEQFSGAMVNRLWKHYFSVGLVEPVDDLRATNPPSNPELWQALIREFVNSKYDLRHVMRLVLNSRTYQLSAATRPENKSDARYYSHYYSRRLPAEVLLDAISHSTGRPDTFAGYPVGLRAIQIPDSTADSYFLSLFGRSPRVTACACERENHVTLPQLLHLQNGDTVLDKIRSGEGRLALLLAAETDDSKAIVEVFLATLGRLPTAEQQTAISGQLRAEGANRQEVFQDLFWALLNTKEFAFNH